MRAQGWAQFLVNVFEMLTVHAAGVSEGLCGGTHTKGILTQAASVQHLLNM